MILPLGMSSCAMKDKESFIFLGDRFASEFLIQNGCNVNAYSHVHKETALHLIAQKDTASMEVNDVNGISAVAAMLVAHQANINAVDSSNR